MLNIYYGREDLDKDKFMFDQIAKSLTAIKPNQERERILLIVPDQYTLQAERNAFAYLGVPGLIDLEIISQSRLGFKVLEECGGTEKEPIDQYGRHMLLTKILTDHREELVAFKNMYTKSSFIDMANNLISEMKQFNITPQDMQEIMSYAEGNPILQRKLADIHHIYENYEHMLEGKYLDTEDYLHLFVEKMKGSQLIGQARVWISGFDYLTPKNLDVIRQVMATAKEVNVVLTADGPSFSLSGKAEEEREGGLFDLTKRLMYRLGVLAKEQGMTAAEIPIGRTYGIPVGDCGEGKTVALAHLEQELCTYPDRQCEQASSITLCEAANFYAEAETAAVKILELVRDQEMRYRDLVVICNDMEVRASVIKRVFAEYGIPAFLDKKRDILHNPVVELIFALIDVVSGGYRYEDLFRLLKTDLFFIDQEDYEDLENYVIKYKIKGVRLKKPFRYGEKSEGAEWMARINEIREGICQLLLPFEEQFHGAKTVSEKTEILYAYLRDVVQIPEQTEKLVKRLEADGQYEYAEETAQIWDVVVRILNQLIEILGQEVMDGEEYGDLLSAGFEKVEIGLIPPTVDQVLVGTMQRTRVGKLKALLVIGANDGLLPASLNEEGLLSEDEKAVLFQKGMEFCKREALRLEEEQLAMYKIFSKPTHQLFVSYSASDLDGKESKPSSIFTKIKGLYPSLTVCKDVLNREDALVQIAAPHSTLRHFTEALQGNLEGEGLDDAWMGVYEWYRKEDISRLKRIGEGLFFTNRQRKLERSQLDRLYRKEGWENMIISPSGLERYARCPFSHLITYGVRPEERRVFEVAGREIGDIYHYCLMKLTQGLSVEGVGITDEASPWMSLTREECQDRINLLIDEASETYREGVMIQGAEEQYRGGRMKEVCGNAAWALVEHIQQGRIQELYFESAFGKGQGKHFPPIVVDIDNDQIRIEGKIDRVDILPGDYVKIIDYKSGKEHFDVEEALSGFRLQLMLYLRAAMGKGETRPAGVFYFEIAEPQIDATALTGEEYEEKVRGERKKSYKLDGILLDDPGVIESIAGEFSGYSEIIPVRKNKDGQYAGTTEKKLLSEEDFSALCEGVKETVQTLCRDLLEGNIPAHPKKVKEETACRFCPYKGICRFDVRFEGCTYDIVK